MAVTEPTLAVLRENLRIRIASKNLVASLHEVVPLLDALDRRDEALREQAVTVPREVTCPHCGMPFEIEP